MPRMATTVHDRRTVVLAGALAGLVVLTGCSGDGPTGEEKTVTTSPMDSEEARAAASALLHERIASALTEALESHGLPAAPTPTGDTGGWLTTSSGGEGVALSFRAKGFSELTVHVDVAEACAG